MTTPNIAVPVHPSVREWQNNAYGGMNLNAMRPHLGIHQNALLRRDEWLELDQVVVETVKVGLVGIQDLIDNGLVKRLGGLGTLLSGYETVSEMTAADVSMDGDVAGEEDNVEYGENFVPVPIIHKDFRISQRKLEASRRMGESLDVTQARAASRVVREQMESMLFNGHAKQLAGYPIYGYTTAPNRITGTAIGDFGTAMNGYKTMVKALGALGAFGFNGPFGVYVAQTQYNELFNQSSTSYIKNEYQLIIEGLPQIKYVKPSYSSFGLTAGSLVFTQLDAETVDLAIAEDVTPVQWDERGGAVTKFRVMTALVPRIKSDFNTRCGVLHYTGA